MSTNEVSKSQLGKLHKARFSMRSMSNDAKIITLLLLCTCSWKSSVFYSQSNKEKVRLFPLFLVYRDLLLNHQEKYKNCCLDSGPQQVVTHSFQKSYLWVENIPYYAYRWLQTHCQCCSLMVSAHLGSRFYSKIHTLTAGPIRPPVLNPEQSLEPSPRRNGRKTKATVRRRTSPRP